MGRRRRLISSGNTLGVTSGLQAWYDTTNDAHLTLVSSAITQFLDRSGNGNHTAVQSTGTKRPTRALDTINGLQAATFDGGDTLALPSALFSIPNDDNTIFLVSAQDTNVFEMALGMTEAGGARYHIAYDSVAGTVIYLSRTSSNSVNSTGNTNTKHQILRGRKEGSTQALAVDGGAEVTNSNAINEPDIDAGHIGSRADALFFLDGSIAEVLLYNRSLSPTEILQVEIYLANKYGIYHPNATWILHYTADQQSVIHSFKMNKDEAFQDVALNPVHCWLKSEAEHLVLASTAITQYLDVSGKGHDTDVQGTGTARPNFNSTGLNGIGTSEYDGGDSLMLHSDLFALPNGEFEVIAVAKRPSEDASADGIFGFTVSGTLRSILFYSGTSGTISFRNKTPSTATTDTTGNTNTDYQIIHGRRVGVGEAVGVNNEAEVVDTDATNVPSVDAGLIGASGSFGLNGELAEIFFLNRTATVAERLALKTYLSVKFAISI